MGSSIQYGWSMQSAYVITKKKWLGRNFKTYNLVFVRFSGCPNYQTIFFRTNSGFHNPRINAIEVLLLFFGWQFTHVYLWWKCLNRVDLRNFLLSQSFCLMLLVWHILLESAFLIGCWFKTSPSRRYASWFIKWNWGPLLHLHSNCFR